jgi:hypothetical protein
MVIGHEKGSDTASRVKHNFGMGRPEGYRKAARLVELASRFNVPVVTLVDSAGAYPGLDGEARGQAEAIARATRPSWRPGAGHHRHHRRRHVGRGHRHRGGRPRASCWNMRSMR